MGTTRVTTTNGERRGARLLPLLALVAALPLLHLGVTRFAAAFQEARHNAAVSAVLGGATLTAEGLAATVTGLERALEWRPARTTHIQLARLHQASAEAAPATARTAALAAAEAHYRAGLALAPLDPDAWTRLGWLLAADARPREALAAVRFSTLIATHDPEQRWWRLGLWLRLWPRLEAADLALLRRQLHLTFDTDPARTAALAARHGRLYAVGRELAAAGVDEGLLATHFPVAHTRLPPLPPAGGR